MRLDPDEADAIRQAYRACGSLRETARQTGRDPKTVTRYVKEANIPVGPAHGRGGRADGRSNWHQTGVDDSERERMAVMATAGMSQAQIAQALGRGPSTVRTHLRRMGIAPMSPADRARRYPLDERAFSVVSPPRNYWAGFIAADGNVFGTKLTVVQMAAEATHLRCLQAFLRSPRPLYWTPTKNACAAVAWSRPLINDLHELGITERKSRSLRLEDDLARSPACWLGLLDGDGWVTDAATGRTPCVTWSGSRAVMEQCVDFWEPILGRRFAVYRPNSGDLWAMRLTGCSAQHAATVLLDSVAYSMPRKRRRLKHAAAYRSPRVRARLRSERARSRPHHNSGGSASTIA